MCQMYYFTNNLTKSIVYLQTNRDTIYIIIRTACFCPKAVNLFSNKWNILLWWIYYFTYGWNFCTFLKNKRMHTNKTKRSFYIHIFHLVIHKYNIVIVRKISAFEWMMHLLSIQALNDYCAKYIKHLCRKMVV